MAVFDPMPASVSAVFPAAADYNMFQGLGKYDTAGGYLSNARHAAASALQRDALGGGIMGGIGANVLGGVNELSGLAKAAVRMLPEKYGGSKNDDFGETWRQTKEDLAANLYGSLYGKSTTDDMEYKFSPAENVYSDMIGQLGASSGTGFKGWLENIMEQEAEGSTLPHTLTLQGLQLHQQRLMNRRKQIMQQNIKQAEAAKQKVTTGGPPSIISRPPSPPTGTGGPPSILSRPTPPVTTAKGPPSILSRPTPPVTTAKGPPSILSRPTPSAPIRTGGPPSQGGGGGGPPSQGGGSPQGGGSSRGRGRNPWGRADGGLINFYRHGGFI